MIMKNDVLHLTLFCLALTSACATLRPLPSGVYEVAAEDTPPPDWVLRPARERSLYTTPDRPFACEVSPVGLEEARAAAVADARQ